MSSDGDTCDVRLYDGGFDQAVISIQQRRENCEVRLNGLKGVGQVSSAQALLSVSILIR